MEISLKGNIIAKTKNNIFRLTEEKDLDFVLKTEAHPENIEFVYQWSKEEHFQYIEDKDSLHIIIENSQGDLVGYMMISGITSPHKVIELKRLAIQEKGKGIGKEAVDFSKKLAFENLKAHRLWLDVRDINVVAQRLYIDQGFVTEGLLRECHLFNGVYESMVIMSILEKEYFLSKSN